MRSRTGFGVSGFREQVRETEIAGSEEEAYDFCPNRLVATAEISEREPLRFAHW